MSRSGLVRALASIVAGPGPATATVAAALELPSAPTAGEHTEVFDLQCYPYASVHLGDEGQLGGEARDRIAGFLRALDVVPPPEPDHLAVLLDAYASLMELDEGGSERAGHARRVLLHEHLASWVGRHLERVAELAPPSLAAWAEVSARVLAEESDRLGHAEVLAPALEDASALSDPREEGAAKAFLGAVLAPARSGLVLARADLSRAADELGIGARIGERAYALRAMLAQDGPAVLDWLSTEAQRQAAALDTTAAIGGPVVAAWWTARLERSAALLAELA
ncbi:MAG: hypothetical protein RLZZ272_1686, partial [Actinomycetota bacterium]